MSPPLGHPRVHLRVTDSTSDRARALALAGAPHGTLVTTAEQTAGRGRQGRRWSAPAGQALLCSLVLRSAPPLLPLVAGLAVCDVAGPRAMVKWPNDVVLARAPGETADRSERAGEAATRREADGLSALAKLGGILVEARPQAGWAVLGIGLNVAVRVADLPRDVRASAATMGATPAAIEPTLASLLDALRRRLGEPAEDVLAAYRARDALRGRDVAWSGEGGGSGRVHGIDERGRLLVAVAGAGTIAIDSGEVHLRS